jgi:cell division protein ZapA (FtsZ GTPase activity inhibitor)
MLGLAVLVALNIADEYFRARQQTSTTSTDFHERTMRLERMVDDMLAQVAARRAVAAP